MKGQLSTIIILLIIIIGIVIFVSIGTNITGLTTGLNNLSANFTTISVFNFTGSFNQSLNTSDNVLFMNLNVTKNLTVGNDLYLTGRIAPTTNAQYINFVGKNGNAFTIWDVIHNVIGINYLVPPPLDYVLSINGRVKATSLDMTGDINASNSKFLSANVSTNIWLHDSIIFNNTNNALNHYIKILDANNDEVADLFYLQSGKGGNSITTDALQGGTFYISAGNGGVTSAGGFFSGNGGDLVLSGGLAGTGTAINTHGGTGGSFLLSAGNGGGGGAGGNAGNGGLVEIAGGSAGGSGNDASGGNIFIYGGNRRGTTSTIGNVYLANTQSTARGQVGIRTGTSKPLASLDIRATAGINTLQITGNTSIIGTGSNLTIAGRVAINSRLAINYSLNVGDNINASAYVTNGSDWAESVPKLNIRENITAGDIVGIIGGKATKTTLGADSYHVVSSKAGVLAGDSGVWDNKIVKFNVTYLNETTNETYVVEEFDIITVQKTDYTNSKNVPIAFIGQVKVKVGSCVSGNWVIISGLNDGQGVCIDPKVISTVGDFVDKNLKKVCTA